MSKPSMSTQVLALATCLLAASACQLLQREAAPAGPEPLIMRAYKVPSTYGPEIGGMLKDLLWRGKEQPALGQVEIGPSGQLLVAAPRGFHEGVQQFLASLEHMPPTPPPTIELHTSIVFGRTGQAAAPKDDAVLAAVHKLRPDLELKLLEQLSVVSLSGEHARVVGSFAQVEHTATLLQDKVLARLFIQPVTRNDLDTQVQIPLDKTLVLGQAGVRLHKGDLNPFTGERLETDQEAASFTVFYVVRATVVG